MATFPRSTRRRIPLCILLAAVATSLLLLGCSGGGGDSSGSSPLLSDLTYTPESVAAGLTVTLNGTFTFSDPDGDLNGGSMNFDYEGTVVTIPLPAELSGVTWAVVYYSLTAVLSSTTGTIDIPFWLVDGAGNRSNTLTRPFTQFWTRQYGTPLEDIGRGIAVDTGSNVVVAGNTFGDLDGEFNQGGSDAFITRHAADTSLNWTRLLGSSSDDHGRAVAIDSSGSIYVAGETYGTSFDGQVTDGSGDAFLSRLDGSGNRIWTRLIHTAGSAQQAYGVAVDGSGAIYVTGRSYGSLDGEAHSGSWDAFLVKYDSNGNRLWTRLLGTIRSDTAYAITTDADDNVYLTGGTDGELGSDPSPGDPVANFDIFVAKYDPSGTLQWVTQHGSSCSEWASAITVTTAGNLYIGGRINQCALPGTTANGGYDAFIAYLDASGSSQWMRQIGTTNHDAGNGVACDGDGNGYLTGYIDSLYSTTDDNEGNIVFLAKYDTTGTQQWLAQEGGGYAWGNQGMAVTSNGGGNLFVTGTLQGEVDGHTNPQYGEDSVFILKYDATGNRR